MPIEHNFVSVLPTVLIDPVLRLRLSRGRWTPESSARGGSAFVELSYDPEIRPDRLTMPLPEEERRLFEMLGAQPAEGTAFRSDQSRRIAEIFVDIFEGDNDVRLEFTPNSRSVKTDSLLISQAEIPAISDRSREVLRYMFESIPQMDVWETEYAQVWGKRWISFCVSRSIAEELSVAGSGSAQIGDQLVKIATREVTQ